MLLSILNRLTVVALLAVKDNAGCAQVRGVDACERTSRLGGLPWCSGMMIACALKIGLYQVSTLFRRQYLKLVK
jgi:hypothetical protein